MVSKNTQSFFGFGQSAEIDVYLDGQETRKTAEVKTEDGKKERLLLYYDGETVSGKVNISLKNLEVNWSIKESKGNHHEFISLVKELARPGEMIANSSYPFEFSCVEKPFEVFSEGDIIRRLADIVKEVDIAVHTLSSYPEMNNSIKMEVGIEDCTTLKM
nr:unnamed protein product [Callosobruchus analis]